ncbi:PaaI family thioesterase [Robbsia betulipollinis]|uniref:PaaI family thioesterase n=1 Tax=Robbsia betulipollinis TaxID=2981849 RepID=UPI003D7B5B43
MSANIIDREAVEAKLRRGPYHEWLGIEVVAVGEGTIELTARWREEWIVNPEKRYTHGGILATLIDLTADWALVSKTGRGVPTIDLRVDYHRPAMPGDLRVKGRVIKFGSQVSVAEAEVLDADGKLLASGRGAYSTATPAAPAAPRPTTPQNGS